MPGALFREPVRDFQAKDAESAGDEIGGVGLQRHRLCLGDRHALEPGEYRSPFLSATWSSSSCRSSSSIRADAAAPGSAPSRSTSPPQSSGCSAGMPPAQAPEWCLRETRHGVVSASVACAWRVTIRNRRGDARLAHRLNQADHGAGADFLRLFEIGGRDRAGGRRSSPHRKMLPLSGAVVRVCTSRNMCAKSSADSGLSPMRPRLSTRIDRPRRRRPRDRPAREDIASAAPRRRDRPSRASSRRTVDQSRGPVCLRRPLPQSLGTVPSPAASCSSFSTAGIDPRQPQAGDGRDDMAACVESVRHRRRHHRHSPHRPAESRRSRGRRRRDRRGFRAARKRSGADCRSGPPPGAPRPSSDRRHRTARAGPGCSSARVARTTPALHRLSSVCS